MMYYCKGKNCEENSWNPLTDGICDACFHKRERAQRIALIALFVIALALGIGYLIWLNAGCDTVGVMTWDGKKCLDF